MFLLIYQSNYTLHSIIEELEEIELGNCVNFSNKMRETEHCALKLTIFIIWAQAFVGYCPLRQVQWNENAIKTSFTQRIKRDKRTYVT